MSRVGNPYDNAKAERFMKTLKTEEVDAKTYLDLDDARRQIGAFIETVHNKKRLHSALGYKPPVEFEAELRRDNRNGSSLKGVGKSEFGGGLAIARGGSRLI